MKHFEFVVDGKKLRGTLVSPKKLQEKNPAILFLHGWRSDKERSYEYANGLARLDYLSFLFNMRGHDGSEGDINTATTEDFFHDALAVYDYLVQLSGVDVENISCVGNSFGAYLALLLTTRRKVKRLALRVPADYPNDAFHKPKMQTSGSDNPAVFAWRAKTRSSKETFALRAIANYSGEILIIESENDNVVPHQTIQNYIDAVTDRTKLRHVVMDNAPHSIKEGPLRDEVEKILVAWFKKGL